MRMHIMWLVDSCPSSLDSIFKIFGPGPKLSRASSVNDLMTALFWNSCPKTRHFGWSKIQQLNRILLELSKRVYRESSESFLISNENHHETTVTWYSVFYCSFIFASVLVTTSHLFISLFQIIYHSFSTKDCQIFQI